MAKIVLEIQNLLTFDQAAELLSVSRQTIYNYIEQGRLYPIAIGRQRFLLRDAVLLLRKGRKSKEGA